MQHPNFVTNTLNGAITAGAGSLVLNSGTDFPNPGNGYYFAGIWDAGTYSTPQAAFAAGDLEIVLVTSKSTHTLTIQRGYGRTSAAAHDDGDTVAILLDQTNLDSAYAVNVKSWGATGDGTTNDSDAVDAAYEAAVTLQKPLFFPSGTYLLSRASKVMTGAVSIIGSDREDTIIKGDGTNRFLVGDAATHDVVCSNIGFEQFDIVFDYNDLDAAEVVQVCSVQNCHFQNCGGIIAAKSLKPSGAGLILAEISNCFIDSADEAIVDFIQNLTEFKFTDNVVQNSVSTDTYLIRVGRDNGTTSEQDDWLGGVIKGNVFRNNTFSGSPANPALIALYGKRFVVSDNVIFGMSGGTSTNRAIQLQTRFSVVRGNAINFTGTTPIGVRVYHGGTAGVQAWANTIDGNNIDLENTAGGVAVQLRAPQSIVTDNMMHQVATGVLLEEAGSGTLDISDVIIRGNNMIPRTTGTTRGIHFNAVTGGGDLFAILIDGNLIGRHADGFTHGIDFDTTGIRLDSGAAGSGTVFSDVAIMNNAVKSDEAGSTGIHFLGTGNATNVDIWGNTVFGQTAHYNFTMQPEIQRFFENIDDNSPIGNWVAGLGAIAISIEGTTGSFLRKATGDNDSTGWVTP